MLNNFKMKYMEFMRERNGTDELYIAMLVVYAVMVVINAFVGSLIFSLIIWGWLFLSMFRFFSKNVYKRQSENAWFLNFLSRFRSDKNTVKLKKESKLTKKIKTYKTMFRDRKTHVFKKCPSCKATIRLPKRKGKHMLDCPKCSKEFSVKIR